MFKIPYDPCFFWADIDDWITEENPDIKLAMKYLDNPTGNSEARPTNRLQVIDETISSIVDTTEK